MITYLISLKVFTNELYFVPSAQGIVGLPGLRGPAGNTGAAVSVFLINQYSVVKYNLPPSGIKPNCKRYPGRVP